MKTSKYSGLSKQDLIEIIERIPLNFVYDAIKEIREKAFMERSEAYIQELTKLNHLKEELQKKGYSEQLNLVLSEAKNSEAIYKKLDTRYENLNSVCEKIIEEDC